MATIDLATGLGSGIHSTVASNRFPINYVESTVDLTVAATSKGSALAAADIIQAIGLPTNSVVLSAGFEVLTANAGSSALTIDLGVTGIDVDVFVDGFNFVTGAVGDFAQQPAAYQPVVIGNTADTLDLVIATLTDENTAGAIRVWALIADVTDQRKPGIAQLRS